METDKDTCIVQSLAEIDAFWAVLDRLVAESTIVIDRPKGSRHPRYDYLYVADYGYLQHTTSPDGAGIDIWQGTDTAQRVGAVICTIDVLKRDAEIKILLGCTEAETQAILDFHNASEYMKGLLLRRNAQSQS